jgi:predicted deacylase
MAPTMDPLGRETRLKRQTLGRKDDLEWGTLTFEAGVLAEVPIPFFEILSAVAGPRLAVMAGMHPNEVSSMEAALRLKQAFSQNLDKGSVSILPILNIPGLYEHAQSICPIDGKNINFSFPGNPNGSFSEALAHALVTDWNTGRATNVLPMLRRHAVMSEAGANGRIDEESVAFHICGVLDMARELGLIGGPKTPHGRANRILRGYEKIESPATGRFYREIDVNDRVEKGQPLAIITDIYGHRIAELCAPLTGRVVMVVTHAIVNSGEMVCGIGELISE